MALIDYNNGTATISINGGQAPFSYLLLQDGTAVTYSGVNFQNPIVSSNNSVVFGDSSDTTGSYGLPSGTYTCQITDDLGCVVTTSEIVVGQTQEATTTTEATTTSTTLLQEYLTLTVDQTPVNEGLNVLFTLISSNIPNNTMVDWAISGDIDSNDISGGLAGSFTMVNNQAQYLATIENDELLEGQEEFTLTLAAIDTNGITAGLSVDVIINDMNTAATTLATAATTLATAATTLATNATAATTLATNATAATTLATPATAATTLATPATAATTLATNATAATTLATPATTSTTLATTSTTLATTSTTLATTSTTLATTSTTLATTSTTLATTTTAAPEEETFYHFHMGGSTYPFTDALGTGTAYLIGDAGYTPYPLDNQTNVDLIMSDLIDNSNGGGSTCTLGTFEFAGPIDGTNGCNNPWTYNVSGDNWYYLAVPNNAPFNVNLVTDGLMQQDCSGTYNASERRAFTYNGESYWLYKMQNGQDSAPKTFNFK